MTARNAGRLAAFILSLISGLALFGYLIWQQGILSIVDSVASFGFLTFVGFTTISLTNFIFYSLRWQLIINHHLPKGERVPLHKVYMHRMGGYAVSYLTPAAQVGGEPVRIALLSGEKNVSVKQATSSVVLDIAFELSAYLLFIVAGVVLAVAQGFGDANSLTVILIGLVFLLLILLAFFTMVARGKGFFGPLFHFLRIDRFAVIKRFSSGLIETENMMHGFLKKNPKLVFAVAFISVMVISFRIVEVFYISHFFGISMNFAQAFLTSTLPGIALILPVPAGVGVFEGGFTAVFAALAIPLNPVAFALIIRARDVVFITIGSLHIVLKGSNFLRKKILHPIVQGE